MSEDDHGISYSRDRRIENLNATLDKRDAKIAALEDMVDEIAEPLAIEITKLRKDIEELEATLAIWEQGDDK